MLQFSLAWFICFILLYLNQKEEKQKKEHKLCSILSIVIWKSLLMYITGKCILSAVIIAQFNLL